MKTHFVLGEGFAAIQKHFQTAKHKRAAEKDAGNPRDRGVQLQIQTAIRNQEDLSKKDRTEKEKSYRAK